MLVWILISQDKWEGFSIMGVKSTLTEAQEWVDNQPADDDYHWYEAVGVPVGYETSGPGVTFDKSISSYTR